jgi:hypothetical protein
MGENFSQCNENTPDRDQTLSKTTHIWSPTSDASNTQNTRQIAIMTRQVIRMDGQDVQELYRDLARKHRNVGSKCGRHLTQLHPKVT